MATVPTNALSDRLSVSISLDDAEDASEHHSEASVRFIYEVARRAGVPTYTAAAAATRATLSALGEWLEPSLRHDVAEHLPEELADTLTALSGKQPRRDDVVALYRCVLLHEDTDASLHDIALRCAAVLAVLGETLPDPLVERLVGALPGDIAALVTVPARR